MELFLIVTQRNNHSSVERLPNNRFKKVDICVLT